MNSCDFGRPTRSPATSPRGAERNFRNDDRPLPLWRALDLARQTLRVLAFSHIKGVVHGDLKPTNVFFQALPAEASSAAAKRLVVSIPSMSVGESCAPAVSGELGMKVRWNPSPRTPTPSM